MYKVQIEQFEGPLDLLLEIIEAKKIPLHEISLAEIADQFLAYLDRLEKRSIEELVGFLVIASRLALLKSRELVPSVQEENEPDGSIKELQRQLALYKTFRTGAGLLKKRDGGRKRLYSRVSFADFESIFYFPENLKKKDLAAALKSLVASITLPQKIPQARIRQNISLEQCLEKLLKICASRKQFEFYEIFGKRKPEEKLVHFLGVLELLRVGKVMAEQKKNFGKIRLAAV